MAGTVGGGEGLGEVAALAQDDAVLEAGATLRRALRERDRKQEVRSRSGHRCDLRGLKRRIKKRQRQPLQYRDPAPFSPLTNPR